MPRTSVALTYHVATLIASSVQLQRYIVGTPLVLTHRDVDSMTVVYSNMHSNELLHDLFFLSNRPINFNLVTLLGIKFLLNKKKDENNCARNHKKECPDSNGLSLL